MFNGPPSTHDVGGIDHPDAEPSARFDALARQFTRGQILTWNRACEWLPNLPVEVRTVEYLCQTDAGETAHVRIHAPEGYAHGNLYVARLDELHARREPETVTNRKSRKRPEFTPEQREEYRKAQREQSAELMKEAVGALLTSEGWRAWAAMRGRMHSYSLNNTLLILAQMPTATMVASGKFWTEHGRMMHKGERALRVSAPLFRKPTPQEIAAGRKPDEKVLFAFKLVPVFDISQTHGDDLPVVEPAPIEGDTHAAYLRPLEVFAHSLGFSVSYEDLSEGLGGYCDFAAKHIAVTTSRSPNSQVKTLVHEIAHALGIAFEYGREVAEVLVETVAFIVCTSIGLATDAATVPYVTSWGGNDAVAAIEKFAGTVDEVARKIERAVKDAEVAVDGGGD